MFDNILETINYFSLIKKDVTSHVKDIKIDNSTHTVSITVEVE